MFGKSVQCREKKEEGKKKKKKIESMEGLVKCVALSFSDNVHLGGRIQGRMMSCLAVLMWGWGGSATFLPDWELHIQPQHTSRPRPGLCPDKEQGVNGSQTLSPFLYLFPPPYLQDGLLSHDYRTEFTDSTAVLIEVMVRLDLIQRLLYVLICSFFTSHDY